jgi:hypothetical protein
MIRKRRMAMPQIIPQEIIPQTQEGMSGGTILIIFSIFILVCGGGGFAIWWFFIRCPSDCENSDDCCEGQQCNSSKCCGLNNYECSDNSDCCNENCSGGKCASDLCKKISEACVTDEKCCDDLMCIDSKCSNCNDEDESCSSNNQCCNELNCRDGKCSSCKSNDESCTEDSECCTNECKEGKCFIDKDTCKNLNEACTGSNCCEGLECENSICSELSPPPSGGPPSPPPSGGPPSPPYCEWTNIGEDCETHCKNKGKTCDSSKIKSINSSNFETDYECSNICDQLFKMNTSTSMNQYTLSKNVGTLGSDQCFIPEDGSNTNIDVCTENKPRTRQRLCVCK